jgi:hypothetical protein
MAAGMPFESLLELDALTILETDRSVAAFGTQPETFRWRDHRGRMRRYTPDLLIATALGRVYREVKPRERYRRDPTLGGRHGRIVEECEARHAGFGIWTCDDIRREPRLSNARAVLAEGRRVGDPAAEGSVRLHLQGCATVGALAGAAGLPPSRALQAVLRLVAMGDAGIDLDERFAPETRVFNGGAGR